jgi:hypothetical protein
LYDTPTVTFTIRVVSAVDAEAAAAASSKHASPAETRRPWQAIVLGLDQTVCEEDDPLAEGDAREKDKTRCGSTLIMRHPVGQESKDEADAEEEEDVDTTHVVALPLLPANPSNPSPVIVMEKLLLLLLEEDTSTGCIPVGETEDSANSGDLDKTPERYWNEDDVWVPAAVTATKVRFADQMEMEALKPPRSGRRQSPRTLSTVPKTVVPLFHHK